jgi:phosphate transport system protein
LAKRKFGLPAAPADGVNFTNQQPMENLFEKGIDNLRQKLLLMASRAGVSVNDSVRSLLRRDHDLALHVREDDRLIDQCEVEIDELAIQLLTQAPLATYLRFVTVAMKISQNLERVGDEAAKIAKRARDLAQEPAMDSHPDLPRLAEHTLAMLNDALDAFVHRNPAAARAVIPRDREADAINREIQSALMRHMEANPDTIPRCLHWMVASQSLERIADHATNIAEEVVYLCEAQDIRHTGLKKQGGPA